MLIGALYFGGYTIDATEGKKSQSLIRAKKAKSADPAKKDWPPVYSTQRFKTKTRGLETEGLPEADRIPVNLIAILFLFSLSSSLF